MARFYGEVGYGDSVEDPAGSGIFVDVITERSYFGDVFRDSRRLEKGEGLNDDITLGSSISIVCDEYATMHYRKIKYVNYDGELWTVTSVEVRSPRLVLTIGSVYNGPAL